MFRCLAVILCVMTCAVSAQQPVDLPVTRAVLFSSGVGYFEHAGTVEGNAVARLMFKTAQINDVLKSMVLTDLDGGTVGVVTYPSNEPLSRALGGFSVDISANPSLGDLLNQLRGAKISAATPEPVSGHILGVEKHTRLASIGGQNVKIEEQVLNIVTEAGIRPIPLASLQSVQLGDAKLQDELNKALMLLITSRDQDSKPVEIRFSGNGTRKVRVGYLVETPVWKTSYRLDLAGDKPFLQGWAIVENTSDADWKGVALSMVSGQPISFVQDLYTPLYVPRPEVKPELYASLVPRRYDGGVARGAEALTLEAKSQPADKYEQPADSMRRRTLSRMPAAAPNAAGVAGGAGFALDAERIMPEVEGLQRGVQSIANAAKLAELFRFSIAQPVDLSRRRSAMLPIVNQTVAAEKVSIYNMSTLAKHPLNGVWLVNDTKLKLLGGPVTVFDGGSYAGDAQIGHLASGDKRLLGYAVDLEVTADPSDTSDSAITALKIAKGVMMVTHKHQHQRTYVLSSKAEGPRKIVIEHPFDAARKLVEPSAFEEKTAEVYRFRTELPAGKTGRFVVREEQTESQGIALTNQAPDTLAFYVKQGAISPKVREALQGVIAMKQELTDRQRAMDQLVKQLNDIQTGQQRLRENIHSVGVDSTLGKRYVAKLNQEEDQIEQLKVQIAAAREQVEARQAALADHLVKLTVE
jgi:hypothetical protein